ncbi:MAG: flagellar biosynthetic protein FliR [Acidobacteria bacterium]|nr:flagellar biosynthetic protein FliR [Acidobacteriota bacterium]
MNPFSAVAAFGLLLVRPGMLVMGTAVLGGPHVPPMVRIGLTVLVALALAPFVAMPVGLALPDLTIVIARELAIGLALGLAIRIVLAAAELAGHFAGYQIGLSMGSLIDPLSGVRNNVLAILYANLSAVICLSLNLHHALFQALGDSYRALPVGIGGVDASLATHVAELVGMVFVLGVRIAMPVVVVLLVVELALGLLGRVAPSLNVVTAGAPVRVVAGLLVLAASLTVLPGLISRHQSSLFQLAASTAAAFR